MSTATSNEVVAATHYDNARVALAAVTKCLEAFYSSRKDVLNDRDLLIVHDSIKTADFLKILINEKRFLLSDPDADRLVGIIYDHAVTAWSETSAKDVAVVDVVKVYRAQRDLVAFFYAAAQPKTGLFGISRKG